MDCSVLLFQPSVNTNPRVQKIEAAARTHKILRSYYSHQSHSSSWAPPLWKHKGGSSVGGEQQSAELCQASAQSPGLLAAGGGGGSLHGPAQNTGARQSWQRRGPELARCWGRKEPRLGKGLGSEPCNGWLVGLRHGSTLPWGFQHLLSLQKGLDRLDPHTQSWPQSPAHPGHRAVQERPACPVTGVPTQPRRSVPSHLESRAGTRGRCETRSGPHPARAPGRSPHPGQICAPR